MDLLRGPSIRSGHSAIQQDIGNGPELCAGIARSRRGWRSQRRAVRSGAGSRSFWKSGRGTQDSEKTGKFCCENIRIVIGFVFHLRRLGRKKESMGVLEKGVNGHVGWGGGVGN